MSLQAKISNLLEEFQKQLSKIGQAQISQRGTTELFFDNENNQRTFANLIQDQNSAPGKAALTLATKTQKTVSYSLSMEAVPNQGAKWHLTVSPNNLTPTIAAALDLEYRNLMKQSMNARAKMANEEAKKGSGSGSLLVGSLEVSF